MTDTGSRAGELWLLADDVEDDLRASVRGVLEKHCPAERVIACFDGDDSASAPAWSALARDLGLAALLVPEDLGGAGASAREAGAVAEEIGWAVAPVPFLTSAVAVTAALVTLEGDDAGELLGRLSSGEATAALLLPATARDAAGHGLAIRDGHISGSVRNVVGVAGGVPADVLLVPVETDRGLALHGVPADARGVTVEPVVSLDMTRPLADVTLDGAPAAALSTEDATAALERGLRTAAGLLAREQVGVAAWCLDATVAYLKERRQFGRAVGGFQALKHRLADVYAEVESARAAARYASAALATDDPDVPVAVALAQAYCSDAAVHAAEEAVQLHGGIGMTWEHPAHLYLKRAKADQLLLGSPEAHRADLAALVDLPGGG